MIDRYVYRYVLLDDVSMNEYVVAKINEVTQYPID